MTFKIEDRTFRHILLMAMFRTLLFSFTLICAVLSGTGCGPGFEDELSRAQQEIDTLRYEMAVKRLERLQRSDPEVRDSKFFIDLLSSAYLGAAGLDILKIINHWTQSPLGLKSTLFLGMDDQHRAQEILLSLGQFKSLLNNLIPPELLNSEPEYLSKALKICNDKLRIALSQPDLISKRILIKTIFVNFWGTLKTLKTQTIPGIEVLIQNEQNIPLKCRGFDQAKKSIILISEYSVHLATAASLLNDQTVIQTDDLMKLNKLISSLDWAKDYRLCERLTHEDIIKIQKQFAHY